MTREELILKLTILRSMLEKCWHYNRPSQSLSTGYCGSTALIVQARFGGKIVRSRFPKPATHATTEGKYSPSGTYANHAYNLVYTIDHPSGLFIDLTGDQFGRPAIQVESYKLYPNSQILSPILEYEPAPHDFNTAMRFILQTGLTYLKHKVIRTERARSWPI